MQLGAEAVFVGSGIFKSDNPSQYAQAIVKAVAAYKDPAHILKASTNLPSAMKGILTETLQEAEKFSQRGW